MVEGDAPLIGMPRIRVRESLVLSVVEKVGAHHVTSSNKQVFM